MAENHIFTHIRLDALQLCGESRGRTSYQPKLKCKVKHTVLVNRKPSQEVEPQCLGRIILVSKLLQMFHSPDYTPERQSQHFTLQGSWKARAQQHPKVVTGQKTAHHHNRISTCLTEIPIHKPLIVVLLVLARLGWRRRAAAA